MIQHDIRLDYYYYDDQEISVSACISFNIIMINKRNQRALVLADL